MVDYWLSQGADAEGWNGIPLALAAEYGHDLVVERLLAAGAHVNDRTRCPPLSLAALSGHDAVVARLLAAGADPRANYNQALRWARDGGYDTIVARLLEAEADAPAR